MSGAACAGVPVAEGRGFTYSEAWRQQCEVRWLAGLPQERRRAFFEGEGAKPRPLSAIRGEAAAQELEHLVRAELNKINAERRARRQAPAMGAGRATP